MVYEVTPYFIYGFYLLGIVFIFVLMYLFQGWRLKQKVYDKKTKSHKIIAGIREPDGFVRKYLVPIEVDGRTVKVKGRTYFLAKPKTSSPEEDIIASEVDGGEVKQPPRPFLSAKYPEGGFGPKVVLRYEEWDEGNAEPVRGFYGIWVKKEESGWVRCDPGEEGAAFIQNQLVLTQSEIDSYKDQIHAIAIGERLKELDAMGQTLQKALANIPNKMMVYIMLLLAILAPFIAGMLGY